MIPAKIMKKPSMFTGVLVGSATMIVPAMIRTDVITMSFVECTFVKFFSIMI